MQRKRWDAQGGCPRAPGSRAGMGEVFVPVGIPWCLCWCRCSLWVWELLLGLMLSPQKCGRQWEPEGSIAF